MTDVGFDKETTGVYVYEDKHFKYYKHQKLGEGFMERATSPLPSSRRYQTHNVYSSANSRRLHLSLHQKHSR